MRKTRKTPTGGQLPTKPGALGEAKACAKQLHDSEMDPLITEKHWVLDARKQPQLSYKSKEMKTYQHLNKENLTKSCMQVCTRMITISLYSCIGTQIPPMANGNTLPHLENPIWRVDVLVFWLLIQPQVSYPPRSCSPLLHTEASLLRSGSQPFRCQAPQMQATISLTH